MRALVVELVLPVSSLTEAERCVTLSAASRHTLRKTVGGTRDHTHTHMCRNVYIWIHKSLQILMCMLDGMHILP